MFNDSEDNPWSNLFPKLPAPNSFLEALYATPKTPLATVPTSPESGALVKALYAASQTPVPTIPVGNPLQPAKTTSREIEKAKERFETRLRQQQNGSLIAPGRVVPDHDDLPIGNARRLYVAVLFLDICNFSKMNSESEAEQERVLKVLNLFMAEMLSVVKAHDGDFEKNTGDGLMGYFAGRPEEATQAAVDAAITMHCYNDRVISPGLSANNLPGIKFRIGIDSGPVTIGNIGVRGDHRSLAAIGNTANVACKAMCLLPDGGIVLGHRARNLLSTALQNETVNLGRISEYLIQGTELPYPGWELKYRVPEPLPWFDILSRTLGGT